MSLWTSPKHTVDYSKGKDTVLVYVYIYKRIFFGLPNVAFFKKIASTELMNATRSYYWWLRIILKT